MMVVTRAVSVLGLSRREAWWKDAEILMREIRSEGLPSAIFADLEPDKVILAKTADRSVLGCMNDMTVLCETAISGSGGLARTDLGALNRSLRRNINSTRGYRPPIELVHDLAVHSRQMAGGSLMTGVGSRQAPLVQAVLAVTEPVAWSLVGPGDESVEGPR